MALKRLNLSQYQFLEISGFYDGNQIEEMKEKLAREATLPMPKPVTEPKDIEKLVIVKRQEEAGGKGYFMAANEEDYNTKRNQLISEGVISKDETLYIQEYAAGVLSYLQFFYSPLTGELEFFGVDQRHESDIEVLEEFHLSNN